jgi:hypothetical protein
MRYSTRRVLTAMTLTMLAAPLAGCARQVEVRTGESPSAGGMAIEFTNGLAQAVNVYVRPNTGGGEVFVRQVPGRSTESIPVRGIASGTAVTLRAAPVDGTVSYTRENVVLAPGYTWRVP